MHFPVTFNGKDYLPSLGRGWTTTREKMDRLVKAGRVGASGNNIRFKRYFRDDHYFGLNNFWTDTQSGSGMDKVYVVQTSERVVQRCVLMTTDPGDLVLDPTCGSGTTSYVAEQWGRRWITMDTSRVALALARTRLMGARYEHYHLKDSAEGALAEAEKVLGRKLSDAEKGDALSRGPFNGDISHGFVYERAPHITLGSIAKNAEIDVIWDAHQPNLEELRAALNKAAKTKWEEWEIPHPPVYPWAEKATKVHSKLQSLLEERRELMSNWEREDDDVDEKVIAKHDKKIAKALQQLNAELSKKFSLDTLSEHAGDPLPEAAVPIHAAWWEARRARQKEIDASIGAKADVELLYDRPVAAKNIVRVASPFTVESLSPHRVLSADDEDPWLAETLRAESGGDDHRRTATRFAERPDPEADRAARESDSFVRVVLDNLEKAGVGNTKKKERLRFLQGSVKPFAGRYVNAEARYVEDDTEGAPERKAAIFIGPEYGTVSRDILMKAARSGRENGFDIVIACGFAFEAHATSDTLDIGGMTILKVNMNQDLRMGDRLKSADQGNLFVVFGEPDVDFRERKDGLYEVEILGVDIFNPNTGEQRSSSKVEDDVACWFLDSPYDEQSFFVRHAYFLGSKDPYEKLQKALKAEINEEAWETLYSAVSHPFREPATGKIAVKVINHYGDEVLKVYDVRDAREV